MEEEEREEGKERRTARGTKEGIEVGRIKKITRTKERMEGERREV